MRAIAIASWVARWFYRETQSRIHVLVTHGYLRSLAKLELERSAVGRFDAEPAEPPADRPWLVVAGIAAALVAGAAVMMLRRR